MPCTCSLKAMFGKSSQRSSTDAVPDSKLLEGEEGSSFEGSVVIPNTISDLSSYYSAYV